MRKGQNSFELLLVLAAIFAIAVVAVTVVPWAMGGSYTPEDWAEGSRECVASGGVWGINFTRYYAYAHVCHVNNSKCVYDPHTTKKWGCEEVPMPRTIQEALNAKRESD